jgi:hypothetical protein
MLLQNYRSRGSRTERSREGEEEVQEEEQNRREEKRKGGYQPSVGMLNAVFDYSSAEGPG